MELYRSQGTLADFLSNVPWPVEFFSPEDVQEFQISDDISGALQQMAVLSQKMQEVDNTYPTTMGQLPPMASTTATAVAGAEQRTNQRSNYKSMTFEFTALIELYWMIQQMTYQFAEVETGFKLMGNKIYNFNPSLDYYYKPLSQSIETEQSKSVKMQRYIQMMQLIAQIQHPDAAKLFNYYIIKITELMGDEHVNIQNRLLRENMPIQTTQQNQSQSGGGGASNQYMLPQSTGEIVTRGAASERGILGA